MQHSNTVIIIAGPTAVGKTDFAIQLAQFFNTEIISADSRQCFEELTIGVAKPTLTQLNSVQHYFIGSHSIKDEVNAGVFEQYALRKVEQIFEKSPFAIMVGGTGLYIKAFTDGIDIMPHVPSALREEIMMQYQERGLAWLQQEIKEADPIFWESAEQQNPQRLLRALEIVKASGRSITTFRSNMRVERPFNIVKIGIELPRETLVKQINNRVDKMISEGLEAEVKSLMPNQHLNALQTVGYKEMFSYLNGEYPLREAISLIKISTRQYAKRQMTWFKKDTEYKWFFNDKSLFHSVLDYAKGG